MSPAGYRHGRIAQRLARLIDVHVIAHGLGEVVAAETGFRLSRDPDTVRAADVAFVPADTAAAIHDVVGYADVAPAFVVEVVSPSDAAGDVVAKAVGWLDAGVRLVWVIDPASGIASVYRRGQNVVGLVRGQDAELDGEDVVPGLRIRLADVLG